AERTHLIEQIKANPKEESNYIALMFLYSESGQDDQALEIAKKLEKEIPSSDWAQVSLFKYHLAENDGANAVKAMNIVLASNKIDNKIRHRIMNEFLIFAKDKPQYEADLQKAITFFDNDPEVDVAKEIGKFFHTKKDWDKTIKYYSLHLQQTPDDLETVYLLFQVYTEQQKYDVLAQKSEEFLESYPLQPQFYFYAGLAYNQLKNHKKAKDMLEMGLDYLVDDPQLEMNFNIQLGEAYSALGDTKKMEQHFKKADQILKSRK
ncbi:MAG: cytochrome C biosynthesis protein, partial [Flavobacterium sp.]|nr:cytochrome C biosynthesis protein [Flavobacterium sp.]